MCHTIAGTIPIAPGCWAGLCENEGRRFEDSLSGLGDSDTFDDKPSAVTIVGNCPPELLRRLVTGLSHSIAVTASSRVG